MPGADDQRRFFFFFHKENTKYRRTGTNEATTKNRQEASVNDSGGGVIADVQWGRWSVGLMDFAGGCLGSRKKRRAGMLEIADPLRKKARWLLATCKTFLSLWVPVRKNARWMESP